MHKKRAIFITLIVLSLIAIVLIFFAIKSYNILLSPAEGSYGYGAYGVGNYNVGEVFQQISSQNNNQQSSSSTTIVTRNATNATSQNKTEGAIPPYQQIPEKRKIIISNDSAITASIANKEELILGYLDKEYLSSFEIIDDKVIVKILNSDYEINKKDVELVHLENEDIFIGVKDIYDDKTDIIFGINEKQVKNSIMGLNKKLIEIVFYIIIILLILIILIMIILIYYLIKYRKKKQ